MRTYVWNEPAGNLLRDWTCLEARRLHRLHLPPVTLADWQQQREALKADIRRLAGIRDEPAPLDLREYRTLQRDGYSITAVTYQSRPGFRVTGSLYRPDGRGPFPGVIGVHGHWSQGRLAERVAQRGHILAQLGYVVLLLDAFGSGERATRHGEYEYHGAQLGASLLGVGRSLLGMQIEDNMHGVDLLQSLPEVNSDRIGVTGASGGGNQTMWLAAMDDRITAAVPVVSVGTFESYIANPNCICETLPGGLTIMEEWGALALAAPGALLILTALQDSNRAFQVQEMVRSADDAREVFRLYGMEERLAYQVFNTPHGYWPEMQQHMVGWFNRWLKDEPSALPAPLPPIIEVAEEELMCFPDHDRPSDVPGILEFLRREQAALPVVNAAETKRDELRAMLRLPHGCGDVSNRVVGEEDGREVEHLVVESEPGVPIPCVLVMGSKAGTVIVAGTRGKAALLEEPAVQALVADGKTVCLVDVRGTGETRWDEGTVRPDHELARSALWLGRTTIGDWTADLLAVADLLDGDGIELLAFDEVALAALAAAALEDGFAGVQLCRALASYHVRDAMPVQAMSIFVPGIVKWGDIPMMAALARCPVTWEQPVSTTGEALLDDELAALGARIEELRGRLVS